ncbi:ATP-dependent protease [Parashewanella curva]|uniref:endopeptidase La n=1 Tax=Parashewanella curva TaxID=2338552 RepID=A0A3L8PT70_9GAMM|nr:S16 family serine protease [Parashewanella curva]RLV57783.1 ATP-dependent protease [Parashewanella curva]
MTPNKLTTQQLAPDFPIDIDKLPNALPQSLLLGQERLTNTFQLSNKLTDQHLFIADFIGIEREMLIDGLHQTIKTPEDQFLAASKNEDNEISLQWHPAPAKEKIGILANKNKSHCYLSGVIKRSDLIGATKNNNGTVNYQPGALAKYHTVYICIESILEREGLWNLLLDIINDGYYRANQSLEKVPLATKVVLVGSISYYAYLKNSDHRFSRHFPLLAELNSEIDVTEHSEYDYLVWLKQLNPTQKPITKNGYQQLLSYSSSLVEHQQRLSLSMSEMKHLLAQAAALTTKTEIDKDSISKAIAHKSVRHNLSEVYSAQNFDDKFIKLPTKGKMIGQVNGLTVIDTGDYSYGEPARITCTAHYGDGEVADIERKSELGGNIHAKGMMILSSCLYRIFGRDAPLHLNANIVFEQSYQEIDGDSASVAEYCCLLSAISELPISQSLAVTGALDQFGHVQAIGGVNEKITGFFNLCQRRGLTGEQGVIIPASNVLQLNLEPKIIQAVADKQFHIYQVEHVDEVIELLLQQVVGKADDNNRFPAETVYGKVQVRLDELAGEFVEERTLFQRVLSRLGLI